MNHFKQHILYYIIGGLALLLYANTLTNEFAFDDSAVLTQNEFVQEGFGGISKIFSTGSWDGYKAEAHMHIYRPLQLAFLAVQYSMFELSPFGYHLVHILSYAALCVLIYSLLSKLFHQVPQGKWLAFLSTLLFTTHPVHTEVVANIKGNGDLLAMLFGVISLHFLWDFASKERRYSLAIAALFFFLALLNKETIVSLVGVAFLMLYFFSGLNLKKQILALLPLILPVIVYLTIRMMVFGDDAQRLTGTSELSNVILLAETTSQEIGLRLFALGKNLQLLVYPYPLVYMYVHDSVPMVEFLDIRAIFPLFIYILLTIILFLNFKKRNIWGFAIGFYLCSLFLFSNIIVGIPNIVSERWLLLPSLGYCIALAYIFLQLYKAHKQACLAILSIVIFGYCGYTFERNFAWKNNLTLSLTDIEHAPENVIINGVLANMLAGKANENGKDVELLRRSAYHYEKATQMNPNDWVRLNNLGLVYEDLGEHRKAARTFKKVTQLKNPIRGKAAFSWAKNLSLAGDHTEALAAWQAVDQEYPNLIKVQVYLAQSYEALDQKQDAIAVYQKTMRLINSVPDKTPYRQLIEDIEAKLKILNTPN